MCHVLSRNCAINSNVLYRLKQFVLNRRKNVKKFNSTKLSKGYPAIPASEMTIHHFYYGGVKFHYMTLLACFQRLFGLHGSGKDTEKTECFHKVAVKAPMLAISGRTGSRLLECAKVMQKAAHAACMMEKVKLTQEHDQVSSPSPSEDDDRHHKQARRQSQIKTFKKQIIEMDQATFRGLDDSCTGSPFLHPIVTLEVLFAAFVQYLHGKKEADLDEDECRLLMRAFDSNQHRLMCGDVVPVKWLLTECLKLSTHIRCGDLVTTKGLFYLRSTLQFKDDRKGPIAGRTFHGEHSFVFVSAGVEVHKLVRVLGIVVCEDNLVSHREEFFIGVVLARAEKGYLPYDQYGYCFIGTRRFESHPDIQIFNCRSIVYPAWCMPVNPLEFRDLRDLISHNKLYYCITPSRVLCNAPRYDDLCRFSTEQVNAFQEVVEMNRRNEDLKAEVAAFRVADVARAQLRKKAREEKDVNKVIKDDRKKAGGPTRQKSKKDIQAKGNGKRSRSAKKYTEGSSESEECDPGLFRSGKSTRKSVPTKQTKNKFKVQSEHASEVSDSHSHKLLRIRSTSNESENS